MKKELFTKLIINMPKPDTLQIFAPEPENNGIGREFAFIDRETFCKSPIE